jgi:hypothetical protein
MRAARLGPLGLTALAFLGLSILVAARLATRPQLTLDDVPLAACSTQNPERGRVFHVDPDRGRPDGDGSAVRPWHDIQFLVEEGLLGESERRLWLTDRLVAALAHAVPRIRVRERAGAVVGSGDTIVLASGDYGAVDLSGLANRDFLTITGAPGADVRFSSLDLAGASHFVLRGITVSGDGTARGLATSYAPGPLRADNLILENMEFAWRRRFADTDPQLVAENAPDGLKLGGDCLTLRGSVFHDLESALGIIRGRKVWIEDNVVNDFSVDGIQFSGRDLTISDNIIAGQWGTPDDLHPDCMQGQPPDDQVFGPVIIARNLCVRRLGDTDMQPAAWQRADRFGWQGIAIFNGRWRGITIRCNIVLPAAQHAIALYGVEDAVVEHNLVLGAPGGPASWIAAMPAIDGRPPAGVAIRNNAATAFLNAVHGGAMPPEEMIDLLKVNRRDAELMAMLRLPTAGVTLSGNAWLVPETSALGAPPDPRFARERIAPYGWPADIAAARRLYPLPAACDPPG